MNRIVATLALATCLLASSAGAQELTKPVRYTWIVTTPVDWNEASAALAVSSGDGNVIVMPTGRVDHPWLILRRVEAGSVYIPEDEPHACDVFSKFADGSDYYSAMAACHSPMLMTMPDGNTIVLSLKSCSNGKRRTVSR